MTQDQVKCKFDEIVKPQVNELTSRKISSLMDLSAKHGPRPEVNDLNLVSKLWK